MCNLSGPLNRIVVVFPWDYTSVTNSLRLYVVEPSPYDNNMSKKSILLTLCVRSIERFPACN